MGLSLPKSNLIFLKSVLTNGFTLADYRLFKAGKMLFHMDLCGGCAKEIAEYIDGILFFEEGYYRGSR